jgi:hypothetical protein
MCFALPFIRREVRDNHTLLPGRLELEEMTRLTLVAQLQREQERADQERDEHIAAQKKIEKLQVELEEASLFVVA